MTECCYLYYDNIETPCTKKAEWVIWDGVEPAYDHKVQACMTHVGRLLSDSDHPHTVYPVVWEEDE